MRLSYLNPEWVSHGGEGVTRSADGAAVPYREKVGVEFDCPCGQCGVRCFIAFTNPPDGGPPYSTHHPAWRREGDDFETLTLSPSILRTAPRGCGWHGYVRKGEVVDA